MWAAATTERAGHLELASTEDADESLRVLYVALTRAQSHAITWWAEHPDTERSPLHRLLSMPREGAPRRPSRTYPVRSPLELDWPPGHPIAVVRARRVRRAPMDPTPPGPQALGPATGPARSTRPGVAPATRGSPPARTTNPRRRRTPGRDRGVDPGLTQISPMAALRRHHLRKPGPLVMERIDPRGPDWMDALRAECATALGRWPIPDITASDLAVAGSVHPDPAWATGRGHHPA